MGRQATRKSKPEIRWDSSNGGCVPLVTFDEFQQKYILKICGSDKAINELAKYAGRFMLEQHLIDHAPTASDYKATLDDLEQAALALWDKLSKLDGHELEGIIDSAWYDHFKDFPDWRNLGDEVFKFRRYVLLAQRVLPDYLKTQGRRETSSPIRAFMRNCEQILENCGVKVTRGEGGNLLSLAQIGLEAAGTDKYAGSLHHYIPKKVDRN